jgi:hypothetical protein
VPTLVITAQPTVPPVNPTWQYPTPTAQTIIPTHTPAGVPVLTEGYYEQDTAAITQDIQTQFWTTVTDEQASGGSYLLSGDDGDRLYFDFNGTSLTLYRITDSQRSYAELCIDGACQWVNNYSATELWQQPVTFIVPDGIHSVRYRLINGDYFDLDAVEIGTGDVLPTAAAAMPTIDPAMLQTPVAQAEAAVATFMPLYEMEIPDASGQTYSMFELAQSLGSQGGTIIGIAKGLQGLNLGSIGSVITWAITASGYAVLVYILTSTTPILLWIINTVMKLVDMVLSLLPW